MIFHLNELKYMQISNLNNRIIKKAIKENVISALNEDILTGDLSAKLIPENYTVLAKVIAKDNGILCGTPWFNETFKILNKNIKIKWLLKEGNAFKKNQCLCEIKGKAKDILSGERTALNFLQTLSSTATSTKFFCKLIKNSKAHIFDTRKTIPGLRIAQKYAVLVGGGNNQRLGLFDQILIKENHIKFHKNFKLLLIDGLKITSANKIQIEVENLSELKRALSAGFRNILLDNFSINNINRAILINKNKAILEVSGNVSKKNIKSIAATGVPRISLGFLTKNINAIDLSLLIVKTAS